MTNRSRRMFHFPHKKALKVLTSFLEHSSGPQTSCVMARDLRMHAFDRGVALQCFCHSGASFVTVNTPDLVLSQRSVTSPVLTTIWTSRLIRLKWPTYVFGHGQGPNFLFDLFLWPFLFFFTNPDGPHPGQIKKKNGPNNFFSGFGAKKGQKRHVAEQHGE